jgi:hypothetical protein
MRAGYYEDLHSVSLAIEAKYGVYWLAHPFHELNAIQKDES